MHPRPGLSEGLSTSLPAFPNGKHNFEHNFEFLCPLICKLEGWLFLFNCYRSLQQATSCRASNNLSNNQGACMTRGGCPVHCPTKYVARPAQNVCSTVIGKGGTGLQGPSTSHTCVQ